MSADPYRSGGALYRFGEHGLLFDDVVIDVVQITPQRLVRAHRVARLWAQAACGCLDSCSCRTLVGQWTMRAWRETKTPTRVTLPEAKFGHLSWTAAELLRLHRAAIELLEVVNREWSR